MSRWIFLKPFKLLLFTLRSLTYNAKSTRSVILDTVFEPAFWFVDTFVGALGPVFVFVVICLISGVVIIYYTAVLPVIMDYHVVWIVLHLVIAHWLLINIVFNYFKVILTSPGYPPKGKTMEEVVGKGKVLICKKCIQPKPPRTHHCSVCNRCIFKMDHHCPWINNCVGHFNHRYFISFCVYLCLATLYVTISTWSIFIEYFYHTHESHASEENERIQNQHQDDTGLPQRIDYITKQSYMNTLGSYISSHAYHHSSITFVFTLSSAVTLALGLLTCWHARLIAYGETSIELHINKKKAKELKRKGLVYRNPYNYGAWQNWKMVLGLVHGRSWICILIPSSHPPYGNGMTWPDPPDEQKRSHVLPV